MLCRNELPLFSSSYPPSAESSQNEYWYADTKSNSQTQGQAIVVLGFLILLVGVEQREVGRESLTSRTYVIAQVISRGTYPRKRIDISRNLHELFCDQYMWNHIGDSADTLGRLRARHLNG